MELRGPRQPRGLGQLVGLVAAQLQGHGVLFGVVAQVALGAAIQNAACVHHLGVQQGALGDLAMEKPAMPVRPIDHRRDRQAPWAHRWVCGRGWVHGLLMTLDACAGAFMRRQALGQPRRSRYGPIVLTGTRFVGVPTSSRPAG